MQDIDNQNDIKVIVDRFYSKVKIDSEIGTFFNEIAKVNWALHLPKMYSFWESVLLGARSYKGKPILEHIPLNEKKDMEKFHFDRWVLLWTETVNELYEGKTADLAIRKAHNMANLMFYKMEQIREF